eukprot:1162132-Pelagomonas_calceolata.AAC.11
MAEVSVADLTSACMQPPFFYSILWCYYQTCPKDFLQGVLNALPRQLFLSRGRGPLCDCCFFCCGSFTHTHTHTYEHTHAHTYTHAQLTLTRTTAVWTRKATAGKHTRDTMARPYFVAKDDDDVSRGMPVARKAIMARPMCSTQGTQEAVACPSHMFVCTAHMCMRSPCVASEAGRRQ